MKSKYSVFDRSALQVRSLEERVHDMDVGVIATIAFKRDQFAVRRPHRRGFRTVAAGESSLV